MQICSTYFQELYNLRPHDKVLKAIFTERHKSLKGLTSLILLFDTTKEKSSVWYFQCHLVWGVKEQKYHKLRRRGVVGVLQKMKRKQDYVFEGGMKLPACTQNAGRQKLFIWFDDWSVSTKFYVSPTREGGWWKMMMAVGNYSTIIFKSDYFNSSSNTNCFTNHDLVKTC